MQSPGHLERGKEAPPLHVGKRAILVLIALVMHFHGVYGLLATINDYVLPVALSTAVAVFSIAVMTSENTLANMLALEMDTSGESDRHPFCCGVFDYHLKYCFRFRCYARVCCNRRIYFARLLYYNMNAFLLAGAWFGLDVNRALMTEKIVGGDLTGRIWMNIVYLIFANVVLVCYHELMAQFGVVGDQAVLQFPHEPEPEVLEPDPDLSYSLGRCASVSSPVAYQSEPSPPVATHLTGGLKEVLIRSPSATKTVAKSKSFLSYFCVGRHDIISRLKIIAVFVALTMFWTATWDLFCSIPSEQMVGAETDDGDDDYYDVSVKGRSDEEFKLLFLGIAYASIAIIYMVVTGEIFAVVKRQDSHAGKVSHVLKQAYRLKSL